MQSGLIGLAGNKRDALGGEGFTEVFAGLVAGDLDLSAVASDLSTDRSTAQADGSFTRTTRRVITESCCFICERVSVVYGPERR